MSLRDEFPPRSMTMNIPTTALRAELDAQIQAYIQKGGVVTEIAPGASAEAPAPKKDNAAAVEGSLQKIGKVKRDGHCTVADIAEWAGVSQNSVRSMIFRLNTQPKQFGGHANYYTMADGEKVRDAIQEYHYIREHGYASNTAAKLFDMTTKKFCMLVRLGEIKLEPLINYRGSNYYDKKQTEKAANEYRKRQNSIE